MPFPLTNQVWSFGTRESHRKSAGDLPEAGIAQALKRNTKYTRVTPGLVIISHPGWNSLITVFGEEEPEEPLKCLFTQR